MQTATFNPVKDFNSYVMSFYGEGGIYDNGFTPDEITEAVAQYVPTVEVFCGDSLDREHIRDMVLQNRQARGE